MEFSQLATNNPLATVNKCFVTDYCSTMTIMHCTQETTRSTIHHAQCSEMRVWIKPFPVN